MVRGFELESLLLVGKSGRPQVVTTRWESRDKQQIGQREQVQGHLLG
jgi:heme-degrading monooxygenase HmoA